MGQWKNTWEEWDNRRTRVKNIGEDVKVKDDWTEMKNKSKDDVVYWGIALCSSSN